MHTLADIEQLETPCLLLDLALAKRNYDSFCSHLSKNGFMLRIHAKTCKNACLIRHCAGIMNPPITVSTLGEAEYFAKSGFSDIIYAVSITPQKLERIQKITEMGCDIKVILDSIETARLLLKAAASLNYKISFLVEIDCDGHRSGLTPVSCELLETVALLVKNGHHFMGVLTHAGSAYDLPQPSPESFRSLADRENAAVSLAAETLEKHGYHSAIVSAGSTPTARFGVNRHKITEIRAGVFIFEDCVMASLGVATLQDIAISVLCQVIGKRRSDGAIIIDAGWSALSSDRGSASCHAKFGYGVAANKEGEILPGLVVKELNQEHGIIAAQKNYPLPDFAPGEYLRILPIHACATANMFSEFVIIENGEFKNRWPRCNGW